MKLCVIMVYNFLRVFSYISRYVESNFGESDVPKSYSAIQQERVSRDAHCRYRPLPCLGSSL